MKLTLKDISVANVSSSMFFNISKNKPLHTYINQKCSYTNDSKARFLKNNVNNLDEGIYTVPAPIIDAASNQKLIFGYQIVT